MITITLTGRIPSKKNSRVTDTRTGRSFPSESYRTWHRHAMWQLAWQKTPKNKTTAAGIHITLFFGDRRRTDLTNKAESIMDLLVDYGLLIDDNWTCTGDITMHPCYHKNMWGAVITISPKETAE